MTHDSNNQYFAEILRYISLGLTQKFHNPLSREVQGCVFKK
jgi:hypothetical protein